MWLVGVVVRRYIDILIIIINFPYSTCIRSFFGSSILTFCSFLKCFFGLVNNIAHTPTEDSIFPDEDDIVQNYVSDTTLPSERPDISTTTTYDVALFNNIDVTVE